MCVWQSSRPGNTVLSFRSMTSSSAGTVTLGPTVVILSPSIRMMELFVTAPVFVSISRPALMAMRLGGSFFSAVCDIVTIEKGEANSSAPSQIRPRFIDLSLFIAFSFQSGKQALSVADRFGQPRHRVLRVFFVLKADQTLIFDLQQGGKDGSRIEDSSSTLDRRIPFAERGDVFHVHVVKALAAFEDRFRRVNSGAGGMADVNAETDALVVFFDGFQHVIRGRELFVLRPVIVDGDFDVELLDHLIQILHPLVEVAGVSNRRADHRRNADVAGEFESAADVGLIVFYSHVADAEWNQTGVAEHLRALFALLGRVREVNVVFDVFDGDIFQPHSLYSFDRLFNGQFAHGVGGDAYLQSQPGVGLFGGGRRRRPEIDRWNCGGGERAGFEQITS